VEVMALSTLNDFSLAFPYGGFSPGDQTPFSREQRELFRTFGVFWGPHRSQGSFASDA
jgi:hypothetical protein